MFGDEWLGIDPTLTKKKTIEHACKKLGLKEDEIEFMWLTSATLARPIDRSRADDDIEIADFDTWLREKYPLPIPGDEHWKLYVTHGYDVFLNHAYPDVWLSKGETYEEIVAREKEEYHWLCIEGILDISIDDDNVEDALEEVLKGHSIVIPSTAAVELRVELRRRKIGMLGVELWQEDDDILCLFLTDDGDLLPMLCRDNRITISHKEFASWDSIG